MSKSDDVAIVALIHIKTVLRRHHAPASSVSKHDAIVQISVIVDEAVAEIADSIASLNMKEAS
ncbi:hypothetical protein ACOTJQ_30765 [Achromobacter xylosoxidans]|uniref:hypothetical protein n=1 Tax=Achromobacter TaxID=222 RepID=UPI00073563FC|nr:MULTISPECIES: hypothetical protein [Achromobacter]MCW0207610.1 hypothetical protein [Achromobacter sp.]MPT40932.1 hypothetical protein [Achromobacter sp.]PNM90979.1 hypothetical protein AL490_019070 [Achromobacter xylosoxidans]